MPDSEEDVVQLRIGQAAIAKDIASLQQGRDVDQEVTQKNHAENTASIEGIKQGMRMMADQITTVSKQLSDYLLVQTTLESQRDRAWWKQPFWTAVLVALIYVGWDVLKHAKGWLQ